MNVRLSGGPVTGGSAAGVAAAHTPEALLAERDRLDDLLQSSDDWRALNQLRARRQRGEELSSLSSSQLEAMLLDALADNPFYQRRQRIVAEIEALAKYQPVPAQPAVAAAAATDVKPVPAPAATSDVDDLTRIRGVDAALMRRLHALDVWTYEDIADWWASDVHYISETLGIGSRISAQNWIEQAAMLSMARPGGPRQSKKAIAAAKAKAEAEAKAAVEAARLAAEAKLREEAEAKARAEAEKAAAIARAAAEAAAKKVAEAAARIAAEAKAAAAARADSERAVRAEAAARIEAERVAQAEAQIREEAILRAQAAARAEADAKSAAAASKPEAGRKVTATQSVIDAEIIAPEPVSPAAQAPRASLFQSIAAATAAASVAAEKAVTSQPAAVPAGLQALLTQFETKPKPQAAESGPPSTSARAGAASHASGMQMPRPVAETIFKAGLPKDQDQQRPRPIDIEVVPLTPSPLRPGNGATASASVDEPPAARVLNPSQSIDDAIRSAVIEASKVTRNGVPPPASTELAARSDDERRDVGPSQRGELLLPVSREPSPDRMAVKVRERMGEDLAEVIFDSTRYAAYRNKPEEANVNIVRRQRRDTPRVLPPPVPTAALEARPELQTGAATADRFLKALKGH